MCTKILVCHGDRPLTKKGVYTKKQLATVPNDNKPATYYITKDGKYAIDADFISVSDMNNPHFDLAKVPKIKLK